MIGKTHRGGKNTDHPIEWKGANICSNSTHAEMNAIKAYLHQKKGYRNKHSARNGRRKSHSARNDRRKSHSARNDRRKSHSAKHDYCKFPKTIIVISTKKGRLRQSRPCDDCIKVMRLYKIKNVIYSTGNDKTPFLMEKVATMPLLGPSRGNLKP